METLHGFDFWSLEFGREGELASEPEWLALKHHVRSSAPTDLVLIAHGFRNSAADARSLYAEFLATLRQNLHRPEFSGLSSRRIVVAGVFWPSKAFRESFGGGTVLSGSSDQAELGVVMGELAELSREMSTEAEKAAIADALALLPRLEDDPESQDRFVDLVLSTIDEAQPDPNEGLQRVKSQPGSRLLEKLQVPVLLPTERPSDDEGGIATVGTPAAHVTLPGGAEGSALGIGSFAGSIAGRVGHFLNLATWYRMKERSGTVGARGVAACVRELRAEAPALRIHLVGHSLGGRLVAACANALARQQPRTPVASLLLLQAAFSHYGFSRDNRAGVPGFFRSVVEQQVVAGPMVATFSFQDEVVGKAYAIASRLAGDNVRAVGDPDDPFGGIGRNGAQNLEELSSDRLHAVGEPYQFQAGRLCCLDASGGLITDHGDVRNANVTYALAAVLAAT